MLGTVALVVFAPLLFFAIVEAALRLFWPAGSLAAFTKLDSGGRTYFVANPALGRRYFSRETHPPAPINEPFAAEKPANALRIFVLGESTVAGYPYPANGTFSRVLRDALRDVLPADSVEVINLGIAATNSYTMLDLAAEVAAQHPDAVLIYAGHNEYYGALGIGSSVRGGSSPALVRTYLRLEHLRTVLLLRNAITSLGRAVRPEVPLDSASATFMESVARDEAIPLGSEEYVNGLAQFSGNLALLLDGFRGAGIPVFIASIESNQRSQHPFAAPANVAAAEVFDSATHRLAAGDTTASRTLFMRARDLDVIRFRAPSALDDSIRALARHHGATYVPAAERLREVSAAGVPGSDVFLEHLHPNAHGTVLIAQAFYDAIAATGFLGRRPTLSRLAPWDEYRQRMQLTAFDERIVHHTVETLTNRWPFVDRARALDYRSLYRPISYPDSLALLASRGGVSWLEGKLRIGSWYERTGHPDSAALEYRGLVRDLPLAEPSYRLLGRALAAAGQRAEARASLERAQSLAVTWESAYLLGSMALAEKDYAKAIALLDRSVTLNPRSAAALFDLSLAFAASGNPLPARAAADRAFRLQPAYPGLAHWVETLRAR